MVDILNRFNKLTNFRFFRIAPICILLIATVFILNINISADNSVRLDKMEPSGEVEPKSNFSFTFSTDIAPKSRIGKLMTTDKITFRPAVPGKYRWETPRRLKYLPEVSLQPSTAYTVQIKSNFLDDLKKKLTGNLKFKFSTERFRVLDSHLTFSYNPERKRGMVFQGRLKFNYPVALETLQRNLKLVMLDKRQAVKFHINMTNGGREALVTSEPIEKGSTSRRLELTVPEGLLCVGAGIGLKDRYVKTVDLQERRTLSISETNALSDEDRNVINIRCSEPVDPDSVENFINIKPSVKQLQIETNGDTIILSSDGLKAGHSYTVKVLKGLPALNGNPLDRDFSDDCAFPDLEPAVNFNSPGRYLSNKGNLNLGLETVNISKVEIEIAKIYANNIAPFMDSVNDDGFCYSGYLARYGRVVSRQTINVANEENEVVTTPINVKEFLSEQRRGIFQITACDPENRWRRAAKIAIITDLGILAKMGEDDLVVWVNSLDDLSPKSGVNVSLISYNNQELVSGTTDSRGMVIFNGLKRQVTNFRSYLIQAKASDDLSFICLKDGLIDKTDFPVDGRPHLTEGYEAFLYTDRGVFRPGEEANLVAIVRGPNNSIPTDIPALMEIDGPDGMVFREFSGSTKNAGILEFNLSIPDYAKTGKYNAFLKIANQSVGSAEFNVEDFIPDKIKVELATDKTDYQSGQTAKVKVRGINLYGPPAAGRRVDLDIRMESVPFKPSAYSSYSFGDPKREFKVVDEPVGQGTLNANGEADFSFDFPGNIYPPGYIRAILQATVTEDGGRSVSTYKGVDLYPYQSYIGLKVDGDYYAKVGENYTVKLVCVNQDGKLIPNTSLAVDLYSVTWNSIYRRNKQGEYTYHSERQEKKLATDTVKLANGEATYSYRPADYGCFKLVFSDQISGARSVYEFYATGWGYAPWAMDHPDRIELDLNKPVYKTGEIATVQIKAPFPGKALVTVEREKVYDVKVIDLKENTGVVSIPVTEAYKPNVYVSVEVIRTVKKLDKRAPTRAFGTVPLTVDNQENRIQLTLDSPEEIRPNRDLSVEVSAPGRSGPTYLTLAAVDEGICQLTEFTTPDPLAFFYGKRALNLNTYDLYGMLLPEVESVAAATSPAGDEDLEGVRRRNLNPISAKRVKPVSLWSGLINLNSEGKATVKLAIPQFNGTLRLMAVAASGPNYGSTAKKVLVRDPIVINSSYPRFMAPGDRTVIPVTIFNGTGKEGTFDVKLTATGPVSIDGYDLKKITVPNQQERTVNYAVIAKNAVGKCKFTLDAKGNDQQADESTELAVRPPNQLTSKNYSGMVNSNTPMNLNLQSTWLSGTGEYSLCLAPLPTIKLSGSLKYLLTYPYGCIEQTSSKLFPLLYFDDLARVTAPELLSGNKAKQYLSEGIQKIESMQLRDGNFSFWPGGDYSYEWGSIYASNFLVEARKSGHVVSDRVYNRMLGYLNQIGKRRSDNQWALQQRVYALYVLSLAGKPQLSSMSYIKSQRLDVLYSESRTMLAAAYYYAGDKKTARSLIPTTLSFFDSKRQKGGNFNSPIRNNAIVLGLLADMDPTHPAIPKLIDSLSQSATAEQWGTTQENAFAFMALGKIMKQKENASYKGEVHVDGQKIASFDSSGIKLINDQQLGKGKISIKLSGKGDCYYYAATSGIPTGIVDKPVAKGIDVKRDIFTRSGQPVNLSQIKQGDLLVAKITIKTFEENTDNVVIVDLLPAGLEIENPRLASSAKINWLSDDLFTPSYMDIRDDRLILFADFEDSGTYTFYYAIRAVSCGTFYLPQIKAECMYAPEVYSLNSGGSKITIIR